MIETAFADSLGGAPRRSEQPVVGADEDPSVPRPDGDIAVTADARIDDREDDRVVAQVGEGVGQEQRAGADIEGRHAV